MKKIYAPWRHDYVSKPKNKDDNKKLKNNCVFCQKFSESCDEKNLIVKRYKNTVIILNYHPYNSGHVMIMPLQHKADLHDLSQDVRSELIEITNIAIEGLKKTLNPDGFNVGINLGSAGGGGIPSHLHIHVVPRWTGDTNFLATVGETKIICTDFKKIYSDLQKVL